MNEKKKGSGRAFFIVLILLALAAIAVYFIFFHHPNTKNADDSSKKPAATETATEFTITPCDDEDAKIFADSLVGVWSSYTKKGEPYTYSFDKDGSVRYKKDGENAVDYTYTFKDGLLTIKGAEKSCVYRCSKDAVGMMAKLNYGEWKTLFEKTAEELPGFNGCVYIADDIMYLGTVCLCRDDRLEGFENSTLEGDWIGVSGDTISFAADGSYTYVENAETYYGNYTVDYDKKKLGITLNGKTTDYAGDKWGLDGRVFHIDKQYYFKLAK